jgi:hypothetical protein
VEWSRTAFPDALIQEWAAAGMTSVERYQTRSGLVALVSRDPIPHGGDRWHISVTHVSRVPTWSELTDAAHELRPGVVFVLGLPPKSWWINIHPYCLHLYETRDQPLIEQWRFEGRGDTPT